MTVAIQDIFRARQRLRLYLAPTPLEAAPDLGQGFLLKLEQVNPTHSFKVRGALNAVLSLDDAARERGLVTASSGNHAQALAYAAHLFGLHARIVMPRHTPLRKVNGTRRFGAEVILHGNFYDDAEQYARQLEQEEGRTFISPYNDARVIAGAGTCGLELLEQAPDLTRVIVPVGGGGLIAGIATALHTLNPAIEVIGVNGLAAPAMYNAFYGTRHPQIADTLAEALSGEIEGTLTIDLSRQHVSRIVLVNEAEIAAAMRWLLHEQGWLVEGGAAVGVAAVLGGKVPRDGRPTAIVLTGSNLDPETLEGVLHPA
ncbi:MAG: threonine/serine dehydratase [Anaerolineae bacterium]|nr:threonine/serine dehydratase [Anaerolineae bacterium]